MTASVMPKMWLWFVPHTENFSLAGACPRGDVRTAADTVAESPRIVWDAAIPAAAATEALTTSRLVIFFMTPAPRYLVRGCGKSYRRPPSGRKHEVQNG